MSSNTVRFLSVIALFLCSCTSESHLPFDAISSSMTVPEELIGNWQLAENASELIIAEKSVSWQGVQYQISNVHQLAKTCMILAVAGRDTLLIYPDEINNLNMSAAITNSLASLPLDESGELLSGKITGFERWWYPLGAKYPAVGTSWVYSFYTSQYYHYGTTGYDKMSSSKYSGNILLVITDIDRNGDGASIELKQTIHIDTMHLHRHEVYDNGTGELDYKSYLDSLLIDNEWSNIYNLYYDADTLFIDQDTTRLAVAPLNIRQGTHVNLKLFSVGIGNFPVGRDMLMECGKGISRLNYEGGWSGNTSDVSRYNLELLEFQSGN